MNEDKYWAGMFVLKIILIIILLEVSKDFINHGDTLVGNAIKLLVFLFIAYGIVKNFNEIMKP